MIYVVNLLLVAIFTVLYKVNVIDCFGKKHSGRDVYLLFVIIIFFFIMGMRGLRVGTDTWNYSKIFQQIGEQDNFIEALPIGAISAPIYTLLCWGLNFISDNPAILNVSTAAIICTGLYHFIKKLSPNYFMSVYCWVGLLFFFNCLNGNRQMIAVVILMNASVIFLENWKNVKVWILFVIAIGVHATSVVFVLMLIVAVLIQKIENTSTVFWGTTIVALSTQVAVPIIASVIADIFPKYSMYVNGVSSVSILAGTANGRIAYIYIFLLAFLVLWWIYNKKKIKDFEGSIFPVLVFAVIFGIVNARNELINRMLVYPLSMFIVFIPQSLKHLRGATKTIVELIIIMILGAYTIISINENQNGIMPYTVFWME